MIFTFLHSLLLAFYSAFTPRELLRDVAEVVDHAGVQLRKKRKQLASYPRAQKPRVAVGRIDREGDGMTGVVQRDVDPSRENERADQRRFFRTRWQNGEAANAGSPQNTH